LISKRDVQLGKIALKEGFISKEQLTKCLALKKKLAKDKGKKVALGALLLKKGYLDKDQLQECVKLHNAALEKEGDGEAKKRKKRRSKRTKASTDDAGATSEAPEDASEERPAAKTRKKKSRRSGGEDADDEAATATATKETKSKTGRSKRSRRSRTSRDSRSKRSRKQDASQDGDPLESAMDAVDPSVFASAMEMDAETDSRRLIACPECGKKYRVKRNQVGRRLNCRRCDHRIKVPKDLFVRDSEISEVHPAMEVEEFVLGSGSGVVEDSQEAPAKGKGKKGKAPLKGRGRKKASLAEAAAQAAAAVEKVSNEPSIADLAANAVKHKPKPLAPKKKFTAKDFLTMIVSAAALVALVGGGHQYFIAMPARAKAEQEKARLDAEFAKKFKDPLDNALAAATKAQEAKDPRGLGNARENLERIAKMEGMLGPVKTRSVAYAEKHDVQNKIRQLMEEEGYLYLEKGGLQATRGLEVLSKALDLPGVGDEVRLKVASIQIKHRQYKTATNILEKATGKKAKALLGLAWERGGVPAKAKAAYGDTGDALAPVLSARAELAAGNPQAALQSLASASGLEGRGLAAASLVKALALEAKKDFGGASAAYDIAVANGQGSPVPRAARAEFNLRRGKLKDALADAQASSSPRGILAAGDAQLALLNLDAAMSAYKSAVAKAAEPPAADEGAVLVGGYVDPLDPPAPSNAGAVAACRLAQIYYAQERFIEAQETVQAALAANPTEPVALATLALLALLQEQEGASDLYLDRAVELCSKIKKSKDKPYLASPGTAFVLWVHGLRRLQKQRLEDAIAALELAPKFDSNLRGPCGVLAGRAHQKLGSRRSKISSSYLNSASAERNTSLKLLKEHVAKGRSLQVIEKECHALLARNPYHAQARVLRSKAYLREGKHLEALADANAAIEANPNVREAYIHRALLLLRDLPQEIRDATKGGLDVQAAVALEGGGDRALLHYVQALAAFQGAGGAPKAQEFLAKCLEEDENFAWAYQLKATLLEYQGKKSDAAAALKKFEELRKK
jgi:tetratricopeptide (TPR) repeat protein/DNA-directed RNA polymerase subunit RPC12/RpoP